MYMADTRARIMAIMAVAFLCMARFSLCTTAYAESGITEQYSSAVSHFEAGEYATAYEQFAGLRGYAHSDMYISYIEGINQIEGGDIERAMTTFERLADEGFENSKKLSYYTQARICEQTAKDNYVPNDYYAIEKT